MKVTNYKGTQIWMDFVWKIPAVEPSPSKKDSPSIKILEIDENWSDDEIERRIIKWREDSKKFVEEQFADMRQKLKTAIDKIAYLVTSPQTTTQDSEHTISIVNQRKSRGLNNEPTDETKRKLYKSLNRISKARSEEEASKPFKSLAIELKAEDMILKSPNTESGFDDVERHSDSTATEQDPASMSDEVEKQATSEIAEQSPVSMSDEVEKQAASEIAGQHPVSMSDEVEKQAESEIAGQHSASMSDEVEKQAESETAGQGPVSKSDEVEKQAKPEIDGQGSASMSDEVEKQAASEIAGQNSALMSDEVEKTSRT